MKEEEERELESLSLRLSFLKNFEFASIRSESDWEIWKPVRGEMRENELGLGFSKRGFRFGRIWSELRVMGCLRGSPVVSGVVDALIISSRSVIAAVVAADGEERERERRQRRGRKGFREVLEF